MLYILDTGFFIAIKEYYPEVFPSFWESMGEAATSGKISSVREVLKELESYEGHRVHMDDWVEAHRQIFTMPSRHETADISKILAVPGFNHLIKSKKLRAGTPVADPFVIAKARIARATVVTREAFGKTSKNQTFPQHPRMPDVCKYFNIPCLTPAEFMAREQWKF